MRRARPHTTKANNLTLNRQKSKEIIVTLSRRIASELSTYRRLSGIERVTSLKILGFTITDKLSMSEHVQIAALKFCFKTCVEMKFVDDDDDDDDDEMSSLSVRSHCMSSTCCAATA